MSEQRWWVYDRPLWRDPLFLVALAFGLAGVGSVVVNRDSYGSVALVMELIISIPFALACVGIVGGTVREYMRGRADRRTT